MKNITPAQIRKIWILAREKAMDDELLHMYVSQITHKDSLRNLTIAEAAKVIDALEGKPRQEEADHMSERQKNYLVSLAKQFGMTDESGGLDMHRLDGFCRSRYNVMHYTWLTRSQASKVIEGLKSMMERNENGGMKDEVKRN